MRTNHLKLLYSDLKCVTIVLNFTVWRPVEVEITRCYVENVAGGEYKECKMVDFRFFELLSN